jgi:DNA-directed RNA polymerase specialized sigma24 family protein
MEGDEAAFAEIVQRYKNSLYAFLRQFLNRMDLVEERLSGDVPPAFQQP